MMQRWADIIREIRVEISALKVLQEADKKLIKALESVAEESKHLFDEHHSILPPLHRQKLGFALQVLESVKKEAEGEPENKCPSCNGRKVITGFPTDHPCKDCNGTGRK